MKISKTFTKDNDIYTINIILTIRSEKQLPHVHIDIFHNGYFRNGHFHKGDLIEFQPKADEADTYEEYHKLYMKKLKEVIPYEWIQEMKEELLFNLKLQLNRVI